MLAILTGRLVGRWALKLALSPALAIGLMGTSAVGWFRQRRDVPMARSGSRR